MDNQHLTKKQRRLLKKEQKEQERLQQARKKKIKKAITILVPAAVIIALIALGIFSSLSGTSEPSNPGIPKIEIIQPEYDAGTVSMADGLVKHTYEIKNTGIGDLKINGIKTSCMCTTAILKVNDKKSPKFGMHNNPKFWSQKIAPGKTGFLEVVFDPAFHGPQGTGQAMRAVYISTNDPENRQAEVKLLANVVVE